MLSTNRRTALRSLFRVRRRAFRSILICAPTSGFARTCSDWHRRHGRGGYYERRTGTRTDSLSPAHADFFWASGDSSMFVSTGVTYPNGVGAVVRIDRDRSGFVVSDDGYAGFTADTMNASRAFSKVAPGVAARSGVNFERGTIFLTNVASESLPVAIGLIANTSCRSIERVLAALEQPRIKRSRDLFDRRLRAAYGDKVSFDLEYKGATGHNWQFDAGVEQGR